MSEPEPSEVFLEALAQIQRISQLSDGLAFIVLAGPSTHAQEMLERVAARLADEREVFWHPVDTRGAALLESLDPAAHRPALLVHGLEWLADEDREDVELGLNLSRDTLVGSRAAIVFWVARGQLDEFRRVCPDLFHWRSLLLTLGSSDLPLPAATVARRRHALELYAARPVRPDLYFEPRIRVAGATQSTPLASWAARVDHGCLEGDVGSGKSVGVAMFAAEQARRASEGGGAVPLLVAARAREAPSAGAGLAFVLPLAVAPPSEDRLGTELIERWADRGELQIVIDGFDELATFERKPWIEWLHRLRRAYPGLRTLLVSRPGVLVSEAWQRAVVQPWDRDQIEAFFLKSLDLDRDSFEQLLDHEPIREMASSPIVLAILVDTYRRTGTLPADRTTLLRAYVDALLGRWDAARSLSGLRATTSPQTLCRQLEQLAIALLQRGTAVFGLEDLERWEEPEEEVRYLVERAGLLREVAGGRWAFSHRSLFEHFAAEGLADFGPRQALTVMHDHLDDPLWKDVLRLAATRLLTLVDEPGLALRQQLADVLGRLGESP